MFDLSTDFEKYYNEKIVLPKKIQSNLFEKGNINISRLKSGLSEYNKENETFYHIEETFIQGSMAMHTIIQNDQKDFDIDIAIVFDESNIEEISPLSIRKIIADSMNRKKGNLKKEIEVKTNCVRIEYNDGYHVDFAIFRRFQTSFGNYSYEHAGIEWTERNPKDITEWFNNEVQSKGENLRKCIRLLKTFSKSRESWKMPGGLIQSVLCSEKFSESSHRLDETFLILINNLSERLKISLEVLNPVNQNSLIFNSKDEEKINNLRTRIDSQLENLQKLYSEDCDEIEAKNIWYSFFMDDFWDYENESKSNFFSFKKLESIHKYTDTEEFIENQININIKYEVKIECKVKAKGFRDKSLDEMLRITNGKLPHSKQLIFTISNCSAPKPFNIWWKVRNVGDVAEEKNMIRGDILKTNFESREEKSTFGGPHYVECYIIKNNECVARDHIDVPIEV